MNGYTLGRRGLEFNKGGDGLGDSHIGGVEGPGLST